MLIWQLKGAWFWLILFISDLQKDSYKIGILKSEIYTQFPEDVIIDITHSIRLNNTIEAAFICKQLPENPKGGNIYLNLVGSKKNLVAYVHQENLYIFPNNGLIGMVLETLNQDEVYMVPSSGYLNCIEAFKKNKMNVCWKFGQIFDKRILHTNLDGRENVVKSKSMMVARKKRMFIKCLVRFLTSNSSHLPEVESIMT